MNELANFVFEQRFNVLTLTINNEPWFKGADVAKALGYSNVRDYLIKHVDDEDKCLINLNKYNTVANCDGNVLLSERGNPNVTFINESGLYALIFGSKLPSAKTFKRWVTSEVLPQIRKTGSYGQTLPLAPKSIDQETIDDLNLRHCEWVDLRSCRKDLDKARFQGKICATNFIGHAVNKNRSDVNFVKNIEALSFNLLRLELKAPDVQKAFIFAFVEVLRTGVERLSKTATLFDDISDVLEECLQRKKTLDQKY